MNFRSNFVCFLICVYFLYAIDQVGKAGGEKWKSLSDAVSIQAYLFVINLLFTGIFSNSLLIVSFLGKNNAGESTLSGQGREAKG